MENYELYRISNDGLYNYSTASSVPDMGVWGIVALVLAIVGGILLYFMFVRPTAEPKNKFLKWFKEFLAFKVLWIEAILKITYYIATIFCVLVSFSMIGVDFGAFLMLLIGAPILLRLMYEAMLVMLMIWRNTKEIAKNTSHSDSDSAHKTAKAATVKKK